MVHGARDVRHVDLRRRALLHVVHPAPGGRRVGPLLGRHARRLHQEPVGAAHHGNDRTQLVDVGVHLVAAVARLEERDPGAGGGERRVSDQPELGVGPTPSSRPSVPSTCRPSS